MDVEYLLVAAPDHCILATGQSDFSGHSTETRRVGGSRFTRGDIYGLD